MSVIVSLVIHSPQRYEKFFILSFCRGEKVICMALWVKIGIHKKRRAEPYEYPGDLRGCRRRASDICRSVSCAAWKVFIPGFIGGRTRVQGMGILADIFVCLAGDDEDFAGLFSWLRIQISYICRRIIYFDVPIGTGSKPTDISTFLRTPLRGVVGVGRIEKGPRSCDRSPKLAGEWSWYRDE